MRLPLLLASAAVVLLASAAQADPKVYETDPVKIAIKPARPLVTELANPPKTLVSPLTKQLVASKIETAVASDPF